MKDNIQEFFTSIFYCRQIFVKNYIAFLIPACRWLLRNQVFHRRRWCSSKNCYIFDDAILDAAYNYQDIASAGSDIFLAGLRTIQPFLPSINHFGEWVMLFNFGCCQFLECWKSLWDDLPAVLAIQPAPHSISRSPAVTVSRKYKTKVCLGIRQWRRNFIEPQI